ncbi:hypothetical protein [uncultured Massilia sp.]|uniref:hypothetical protein n=1 Tax=uncultured Massilia sp. TaxID=169973 RepID=UPI0025FC119E|nr:hypothetical protein [uncultured Massilia sp.]
MTRVVTRSRLFAPLVVLAALLLLLEEWCWNAGLRLSRALARWPLLAALERRVRALPPWAALCAFALPGILLFPVKLLALFAIAQGHAASGIAALVAAKLGGAAVVARIYALTLPSLLALGWFARCHGWFMRARERCLAQWRASRTCARAGRALRAARLGLRRIARALRAMLRRRRPAPSGRRRGSHAARVLRRFVVQWRARRR